MTKSEIGIVTKAVGGVFTVYVDQKKYICFAPKKLRFLDMDILVGDKVQFSRISESKGVVEKVLPRKNRSKRPEVANIDIVFILIAVAPPPDLVLVDKIIINCFKQKITPVIIINKSDLDSANLIEQVQDEYKSVCDVLVVSTVSGFGLEKVKSYFENNTVCLAGQSAVGKTSLLNCLCQNLNKKIGDLSAKISRGMHTTRHSQIFPAFGGYIIDTTGFSLLELSEAIDSRELMLFYDDMMEFSKNCKYNMCTHTSEPDCCVKKAVDDGEFPRQRYLRYVEIFKQLSETEKNKYN